MTTLTRRSFLGACAALPFVGRLCRPEDGGVLVPAEFADAIVMTPILYGEVYPLSLAYRDLSEHYGLTTSDVDQLTMDQIVALRAKWSV